MSRIITGGAIYRWAQFLHNPMVLIDQRSLTRDMVQRIHYDLVGSDDFTPIGAPPTRMYETWDSRNTLLVEDDGIIITPYYDNVEDMFGTIWDFTEAEIEEIEIQLAESWENWK